MYRVLIADGDETCRGLLMQALSVDEYQIAVVSSGKDALECISRKGTDVLIMEVHLPDMEGWSLIPEVRRINGDIPVIAVTADDAWETSRRIRIENGPIFFYEVKPLNMREMQEVVRKAVQRVQR